MKWLKHSLVVLMFLTAIWDIYTTILFTSDPNMAIRETNPLYMLGVPLWALYIFKMLILTAIVYTVYTPLSSERMYYYFIVIILVLIVSQTYAGFNNYDLYTNYEYYISQPIPTQTQIAAAGEDFRQNLLITPILWAFIPYLIFEWTFPYQKYKKRRLKQKGE